MITYYLCGKKNCEASVAILLLKNNSLLIKSKIILIGVMINGTGLNDTLVLKSAVISEGCNISLVLKEYYGTSHHCNFIVAVGSDNKGEV